MAQIANMHLDLVWSGVLQEALVGAGTGYFLTARSTNREWYWSTPTNAGGYELCLRLISDPGTVVDTVALPSRGIELIIDGAQDRTFLMLYDSGSNTNYLCEVMANTVLGTVNLQTFATGLNPNTRYTIKSTVSGDVVILHYRTGSFPSWGPDDYVYAINTTSGSTLWTGSQTISSPRQLKVAISSTRYLCYNRDLVPYEINGHGSASGYYHQLWDGPNNIPLDDIDNDSASGNPPLVNGNANRDWGYDRGYAGTQNGKVFMTDYIYDTVAPPWEPGYPQVGSLSTTGDNLNFIREPSGLTYIDWPTPADADTAGGWFFGQGGAAWGKYVFLTQLGWYAPHTGTFPSATRVTPPAGRAYVWDSETGDYIVSSPNTIITQGGADIENGDTAPVAWAGPEYVVFAPYNYSTYGAGWTGQIPTFGPWGIWKLSTLISVPPYSHRLTVT